MSVTSYRETSINSLIAKLFFITVQWAICLTLLTMSACDDESTYTDSNEKYLHAEIDRAESDDLETLQVGSIIKINFKSNLGDSLKIVPTGFYEKYHQRHSTDYIMYEQKEIDGKPIGYNYGYTTLANDSASAYIEIKKPGSFKLAFKIKSS